MSEVSSTLSKKKKKKEESGPAPDTRRRRLPASQSVLFMQQAAGQVRNDVYALMSEVHFGNQKCSVAARRKMPSKIDIKKQLKKSLSAQALGRAKQVQYAIDDAVAAYSSYRSNFFDWVKDHGSRPGKPRPPRFHRQTQRVRLSFDYQDLRIEAARVFLPESIGLPPISLLDRAGRPILGPGDKLVMVHIEPCRSRKYVDADLIIRRSPARKEETVRKGLLHCDLGVTRLVTCLDDQKLIAFFICGSLAKSILARGAKHHAKLRQAAALGSRHGKAQAGALAARSARQMDDLMKKVALILVEYALQSGLSGIAVGRNKNWKQNVAMGRRMNQLFTFIPHEKLVCALRTKCARAGLSFFETEEAHTSITDHLAKEVMGPKPEAYRWLGLREPRGLFRSSVGTTLHADVNGCLGIGRKAGGEQWLDDIIKKLGASPGTRLVPRKIHMNGAPSGKDQQAGTCHKRHLSPRMWTRTQVTLVKAGLLPASKGGDLLSPHSHQSFPAAA